MAQLLARLGLWGRSPELWGFAVVLVRGVGFLAVHAFVLRKLTAPEMGRWYLLLNMAGLAAMVELGFSATIARHASYYWGGLTAVPELGLPGAESRGRPNPAGLWGLLDMSRGLYRRFGLLMAASMLALGGLWFGVQSGGSGGPPDALGLAFGLLTVGSALNMTGLYWPALLFGLNRVTAAYRLTVAGLLLQYVVTLAGVGAGYGLTAMVLGLLTFHFVQRWPARSRVLAALGEAGWHAPRPAISWKALFPMTWRAGLAGVGSFLCVQGTTLICGAVTDIQTTASYGLSLQLALVVYSLAANWLAVKQPRINALRAQGKIAEVAALVRRRMGLAVLTYLAGAATIAAAGPSALRLLGSRTPLLAAPLLIGLLGFVGIDLVVGMHGAVFQTGNRVPHLVPYLVSGTLTVLLGLALGRAWGAAGVIAAPFLAQAGLNYWWTPWHCWRELRPERNA